jgi:hypothetical protein
MSAGIVTRPQPLPCDLKAQQRPRRVFEKGVDLGQPVEPMVGGGMSAVMRDPSVGLVEQKGDFVRLQARNAGQVPVRKEVH